MQLDLDTQSASEPKHPLLTPHPALNGADEAEVDPPAEIPFVVEVVVVVVAVVTGGAAVMVVADDDDDG